MHWALTEWLVIWRRRERQSAVSHFSAIAAAGLDVWTAGFPDPRLRHSSTLRHHGASADVVVVVALVVVDVAAAAAAAVVVAVVVVAVMVVVAVTLVLVAVVAGDGALPPPQAASPPPPPPPPPRPVPRHRALQLPTPAHFPPLRFRTGFHSAVQMRLRPLLPPLPPLPRRHGSRSCQCCGHPSAALQERAGWSNSCVLINKWAGIKCHVFQHVSL